ncbi:unnamed protein product [Colias eurytheme]|nr:unnamed protein product [Colias eurytheme]
MSVGLRGAFLFCPLWIPMPHVQPVSPALCRALTAPQNAKPLDELRWTFRRLPYTIKTLSTFLIAPPTA